MRRRPYRRTRKSRRHEAGGSRAKSGVLQNADVLRFLPLAARCHVELDALTLVERLVAAALDVRIVNEDVVALLTRDEAEALLGVEELDGTCSQWILFSSKRPLVGRS